MVLLEAQPPIDPGLLAVGAAVFIIFVASILFSYDRDDSRFLSSRSSRLKGRKFSINAQLNSGNSLVRRGN